MEKSYLCIDLKSFYASVECVERGLDSMTTNLVVADPSRSDKTICLAVTPHMKKLGVSNRCRVFEIPKNIDYIMAPPRMQKYIDYSAEIYGIYLKYISRDDIHVYSIDEVFMDVTPYLGTYGKTPKEMAVMLMSEVYDTLGIRATAGIGTNLYLAKIALDITAKHAPDFIGELDEESYRRTLWDHRPVTDFWRIGPGVARRLANMGVYTMGQVAHFNEDVLYEQFGIDAELLIDHAWGIEPTTIADIKGYRNKTHSISSGQVLMRDYSMEEGRVILREMVEQLCLDMTKQGYKTRSITMYIRLAKKQPANPPRVSDDKNQDLKKVKMFGGAGVRGTASVLTPTNSMTIWCEEAARVYEQILGPGVMIRGFNISCNDLEDADAPEQMSIFDMAGAGGPGLDGEAEDAFAGSQFEEKERDKKLQKAMLDIKEKFGKNAIFKSADLQEEATALERNRQIGGHKSGE